MGTTDRTWQYVGRQSQGSTGSRTGGAFDSLLLQFRPQHIKTESKAIWFNELGM